MLLSSSGVHFDFETEQKLLQLIRNIQNTFAIFYHQFGFNNLKVHPNMNKTDPPPQNLNNWETMNL